VWLDARHLGADFVHDRFPTIHARLMAEGIDLATDLVPVAPAHHFHSGGVLTDLDGRTPVKGLYAAGEVACTGVHGANRLASNSLLEGLVFACRTAADIAGRLDDGELPLLEPEERPGTPGLVAAAARGRVQRLAQLGPGVIRTGAALTEAAERLSRVRADAPGVVAEPQTAEWETTNVHQVAVVLTATALVRTESRGGHFREDFPEPDEAWRVRLVASLEPDGELVVERAPIGAPAT
jgi:L-aspartate oxidase